MEIFKNKFLVKLIATICLFLTLLNFMGTNRVHAANKSDSDKVWGGVLITPITNLLVAIGDSVMEILHDSIQEQKQAIIKVNGSEEGKNAWATFGAIVIGIVAAVAFIAAPLLIGVAITALTGVAVGATVSLRTSSRRCTFWNICWKGSIK